MWKLTEIAIRNIVSFHEATLKIEQNVATLIFGKNEDNACQPCNGSGKSSLIEAISFGLTGEQLRKVKSIDEIINDLAEDAYVYLKLENDFDDTTFTIERTISRNAPQSIECHKYNSVGEEIETDKTIQASVSDYNKFILNEIGLTKDDIYNNFILCDNKYESFFDCSDKNKKEIINRFSNGQIVDESIERVQADIAPVEKRLSEANSNVTTIKGSISAIENELLNADQKRETAKQDRLKQIEQIDQHIAECRENISNVETKHEKGEERLQLLKKLQKDVEKLDNSDTSFIESYNQIKVMVAEYELGPITEFDVESENLKLKLQSKENEVKAFKSQINLANDGVKDLKAQIKNLSNSYQTHSDNVSKSQAQYADEKNKLLNELNKIDSQLDSIEEQLKENKKYRADLEAKISRSSALMSGVIICPKCNHQFFINEELTVEEVRKNLVSMRTDLENKKSDYKKLEEDFDKWDSQAEEKDEQIKKIENQIKEISSSLESEYRELSVLQRKLDVAENNVANIQKSLISAENEVDRLNGKIEVLRNRLFGEIIGILEGRVINGEHYLEQQKSSIDFYKGQLNQYKQSRKELAEAPEADFTTSLKKSLTKYQEQLNEAEKVVAEIQAEYNTLKDQELNFTMFKSYIARKKIDALSLIVNDFLEKIGSDIRLKLEGFSVTKTGKLRDKISVQVMRDGIDCGSYHKFSGGEKARLNLACILSLHTLTNSNCEDGKGLDFIIIDELLDKSDEMGMTTYCEALNKLGQTSLLITQGGVSEGYPHKLLIVKKQGVSAIQN